MPEREVKLGAPEWFAMPSLDGLGDGVQAVPHEPVQLVTTYHDTRDLRLARWNVSLRHRPGQGWTLKFPAGDDGPLLVREELEFTGAARRPPAVPTDLVRALTRGAPLAPRARLETVRRRVDLLGPDGEILADVSDDHVTVVDGIRFRELEVEIRDHTPPELLDAILRRLRAAGAGKTDATTKPARAFGLQEPEISVDRLVPGASAAEVVRRSIGSAVVRLVRHDPVIRLDEDPEGVHQARVATRRLRSDLRTFGPLIVPEWGDALRAELGWLADVLGDVRDGDVMLGRMRKRAKSLPAPVAADGIFTALGQRRDAARDELLKALRGDRYTALIDRLIEAAHAPALVAEAARPAEDVLPALLDKPWRQLKRHVKALPDPPPDTQLHEARIKAKRCRYAAEAVAPVLGKPAARFARAAAALQEVLGDHNDAIIAETWLREWALGAGSIEAAFAAGEMAGLERAAADTTRAGWPKAWKELSGASFRS